MSVKNEKKLHSKIQYSAADRIRLIPLLGALVIVPLIVRLRIVELPPEVVRLWGGEVFNPDFFSYHKGIALILFAVAALLIFFFSFGREEKLRLGSDKPFYIAAAVFILWIVLSAVFSPYKFLIFRGAPDRYEGVYVWISYLILLIFAMNFKGSESTTKILIGAVYAFTLLITLIGITQFLGKDIFRSPALLPLIIPEEYAQYRSGFSVGEIPRSIYGTSYHYNYMGSLSALLFPFALTLTLFLKEKKLRLFSLFSALISAFLLLGSSARSGFVGLIFFLILLGVLFFPKLVKNKKAAFLTVLALVLIGGGLSVAFGKNLFERIPTLLSEAGQLFSGSDIDYREEIPLKELKVEKNHLHLNIEGKILNFDNDKKEFRDENENLIPYENKEGRILLSDPRYEAYSILVRTMEKNKDQTLLAVQYESLILYFDISSRDILIADANGREVDFREADSIGFRGKERLGSARGYIWSRTLPLLLRSPVFGYGADSFLAVFPQGDLYAKLYAYEDIWMLVDKPHNLYLNLALNFGLPALLAFLALILLQGKRIFGEYFRREKPMEMQDAFALACFMAVVGYLGAGFFNDSVLSVAPIFWVMLGLSIALTGKSGKEREKELTQKS